MLPWVGDPYLIPLGLIPFRYEEAIDAIRWERGEDDDEDRRAEKKMERDAARLKRMARRQIISRR